MIYLSLEDVKNIRKIERVSEIVRIKVEIIFMVKDDVNIGVLEFKVGIICVWKIVLVKEREILIMIYGFLWLFRRVEEDII